VTNDEVKLRVVIAVTETTPVALLWETALRLLRESRAELAALYVRDDREIMRSGGVAVEFTRQRAEQVSRERAASVREAIRKLAAEAELEPVFEILDESDALRLREFIGNRENILVAPSFISTRPIYAMLSELNCRIELVEAKEEEGVPYTLP
jgi:nucleotide-binding universal stress UspA family protein